jgi:hypothetical protein
MVAVALDDTLTVAVNAQAARQSSVSMPSSARAGLVNPMCKFFLLRKVLTHSDISR